MTKIAFAARYADDTPYAYGRLTIRLVDGGSGAALPNGLGVTPRTVNLDADGEAIVDLTPNADISDPVGTFYAVTVNDSTPTVVRYIEVPAPNGSGNSEIPYDWDDDTIQRLVPEPPSSIPAAAQGAVGQVLGIVDDGNGKRYELRTSGGATTDAGDLTSGTVPFARLPIGTTSTTVPAGNDARFSDARTPTAHKTSHATGGGDALAPSDIGAVPTSRTVAGLDLSADRNAAALRAALGLWTPIANETLGSASGSRTYDITGYRFVRITVAARSNRNGSIDSIRLRFNGDTGSNYSTNTTAFTTSVSAFDIAGENTNTDRSGSVVIQFGYMAGSWLTGTVMGTGPSSTATTAANSLSNGFAWKGATSAAPTSIEVYTNMGQFVAGSSFLVEGRV